MAPSSPRALSPETVFEEHFDFVWRSLRRLGVAPAGLDDAAQEVFVVVCQRLDEFEGRSELRSWLFGIALNVARKARRTERRRGAEPLPRLLVDRAGLSPQDAAAQAEAVRTAYELLDRLTPSQRAVFVLAEIEEMTAPEISRTLGIPMNTVYSRWRSARSVFDTALRRHHARQRGKTP